MESKMDISTELRDYQSTVSGSFDKVIPIPEGATVKQVITWEESIEAILLIPMDAIEEAFLESFGEVLTDNTEDESSPPNVSDQLEGAIV